MKKTPMGTDYISSKLKVSNSYWVLINSLINLEFDMLHKANLGVGILII